MFMLNHVAPESAEGEIGKAYSAFPEAFGVPAPLQLLSASPGLFECQMRQIGYYRDRSALDFALTASIRYLAADHFGLSECVDFNRNLLLAAGVDDAELEEMRNSPNKAPLSDGEKSLLVFVMRVVRGERVSKEDITEQRENGWNDAAILDACNQGTFMAGTRLLMQAFSDKRGA